MDQQRARGAQRHQRWDTARCVIEMDESSGGNIFTQSLRGNLDRIARTVKAWGSVDLEQFPV
jgi:hypothetical protein